MWAVHSALSAEEVGLITGARGDPAVKVTGMGGIGKSLLAQEYALRFAAAYPGGVFWLRAHGHDDTGEALSAEGRDAVRDTQLLAFAAALGIDTAELAPEHVPAALARGLDARADRFLWIVDDLPGALDRDALDFWLAPGRLGHTLLTTRSHDYDAIGALVDLGVLSAQEGLELLGKHRSPEGPAETQAARGLVEDLGRHALALDVAGAALRTERGVRSYAAYRDALANPSADELELATRFVGELPGGHEASITTTLARSIKHLDDAGLDFLRLASRLAADPIPADLVVEVFAQADALDEDTARRRAVAAMADATNRSLAETTDDDDAREVHTLVSRTIRLLEPASSRPDKLADAATTALTRRLNASAADRVPADSATLAHARHLAAALEDERQATLLSCVAVQDQYRGDFRSARGLHEQVLAARRRLLGDRHPNTLTSIGNLAGTLSAQGDLDGARRLQEEDLRASQRVLGRKHPNTLIAMNNLAQILLAQGDLEGARRLHERAFAATRGAFGDEHPNTVASRNNLATALLEQGDLAGARRLQEQELAASRRVLGGEHPNTLISMHNLAETLWVQGDLAAARALQEQALAARRRVLGDEHPNTLATMNNLAETLRSQGELDRARTLQEHTVAGQRRVLGDDHPDTLISMSNLAGTLRAQGDLHGARTLHEQALTAMRRVLGDDHEYTLATEDELAEILGELGSRRAGTGDPPVGEPVRGWRGRLRSRRRPG
jgi:Flp pilus assembly protein TadD